VLGYCLGVTENEFDSGAGLEFGQARKTDLAIRLLQSGKRLKRERERERESVYVCVCVCVSVSQRPVCVLSGSGVFLCPAHIKYLYHKRDDRLGCLCPEVIIFVFLLRCFSFTKERA
jgi:hypothetical protein